MAQLRLPGACWSLLKLLLVCGAVAHAATGHGWHPDCLQVSSGCTACSSIMPGGSSRSSKHDPATSKRVASTASSVPNPLHSSQRAAGIPGVQPLTTNPQGASSPVPPAPQQVWPDSSDAGGSGDISWGWSNVWWQPGAVLSCDECDSSRHYARVTGLNGTSYW